MDNFHGSAIFVIALEGNGLLPKPSVDCIFAFHGCVLYAIFVVAEDIFGAVYCETVVGFLSP